MFMQDIKQWRTRISQISGRKPVIKYWGEGNVFTGVCLCTVGGGLPLEGGGLLF